MASSTPPTLTTTKPYQNHHIQGLQNHHRRTHNGHNPHHPAPKVSLHPPTPRNPTANKPPVPVPAGVTAGGSSSLHHRNSSFTPLSSSKSELAADFSGRRSTRFVSKMHFGRPKAGGSSRHSVLAEDALQQLIRCSGDDRLVESVLLNFQSKLCGSDDYNFLLRELGNRNEWSMAIQCFEFAVSRERRRTEQGKLASSMISVLGRLGKVDLAKKVFETAVSQGYGNTVYAYSALISAYAKSGLCDDAINVFDTMKVSGLKPNLNPRVLLLVALTVVVCHRYAAATDPNHQRKTYIVHMDKAVMPPEYSNHRDWYATSMESVVPELPEMLYTYDKVIHGFSTRLTVEQAKLLEKRHGILSVKEEVVYKLHTTRSPEFLGLEGRDMMVSGLSSGGDVVVGVVDTGIWPGSKSLDDTGFRPIPAWWKGECKNGTSFGVSNCNKKLIGATFFSRAYEATYGPIDETMESRSPMDDDGHGTHTATTATGSTVTEASLFGFANGSARGMAPNARLAVYKACWLGGCFGSDILAAMEKAVEDRVHVLSLSIGGSLADYTNDVVAYGAFKAVSSGIFVACSAGNSGPGPYSLSNVAPWIATVGAGTLDREFPAYVALGNGKKFRGVSLYSGKPLPESMIPIVFAGNISNTTGNLCLPGSLPRGRVAGKIVMCERGGTSRVQKGMVVKAAGGAGMILANSDMFGEDLVADAHLIPTAAIGYRAGDAIKSYILKDANPTATIASGGTELHIQPSPVVAAFSSRGPNPLTPEILKPDFIAPGVNILAGWTGKAGPTGLTEDLRRIEFNIVSGTSMSCPHVSGLAALLKAAHPDWTPAAIKSALMTTAYSVYKNGKGLQDVATGTPSTPFDHGAGHVDPVQAMDPGLVYDASPNDYLGFLCALNYTSNTIKMYGGKFTCGKKYRVEDLNYPSFAVPLLTDSGEGGGSGGGPTTVKYTRTLKNVGTPATYRVSVWSKIEAVKITVDPEELTFVKQGEKKVYTVTFTASSMQSGTTGSGQLTWSGGKYVVSSPIAFSWV